MVGILRLDVKNKEKPNFLTFENQKSTFFNNFFLFETWKIF
jgi:hypothetical protein